MADIDARIANHEAGHIVAARLLGVDIADVAMDSTNDRNFAEVQTHGATWLARDADLPVLLKALETDCKVCLAGPYAEMQYEPDAARMKDLVGAMNWGSDMKTATARVASAVLLKTGGCSSLSETDGANADAAECKRLYAQLCNEIEKLVAENYRAIKRVAEYLQHHRTITQSEADVLIFGYPDPG
jgi:hypothetical protein